MTPETIYLIPGEWDGEAGMVWCEDPAPDEYCNADEAVEYVRKDRYDAIIERQASAAKMGMDAAKKSGAAMYEHGKKMLAESSPEVIESERAMNAQLTGEVEQARQIIADLIEYAECNDPGCPHIGRAKGFLSGSEVWPK